MTGGASTPAVPRASPFSPSSCFTRARGQPSTCGCVFNSVRHRELLVLVARRCRPRLGACRFNTLLVCNMAPWCAVTRWVREVLDPTKIQQRRDVQCHKHVGSVVLPRAYYHGGLHCCQCNYDQLGWWSQERWVEADRADVDYQSARVSREHHVTAPECPIYSEESV